jgi:hypothetical protein
VHRHALPPRRAPGGCRGWKMQRMSAFISTAQKNAISHFLSNSYAVEDAPPLPISTDALDGGSTAPPYPHAGLPAPPRRNHNSGLSYDRPELLDILAANFAVVEGLPGMDDWQPGPVGMTVRVGRAYLSDIYPALHAVAPHPDGRGWRALSIVKQEMPDGSNYYSLYHRTARTRSEKCFAKKTSEQDACFIGISRSRTWE